MCTLIALWRAVPGYDVVVGMNRDESAARPSDPPALLGGEPAVVAPRDRTAGGTWIGASGEGLVVALSNRRGPARADARSRGLLVLDALRERSPAAVDVRLQREVRERPYNPWNLLAMSPRELRFFSFDDSIRMTRGREGLNVLTNEGGNADTDPKAEAVRSLVPQEAIGDIHAAIRSLQTALRTHASSGPAICVHRAGGGTVSSTILGLADAGPEENLLLYADGSPCTTAYRDYGDAIRRLPRTA